jgi:hypothetical protein
MSYGWLAATLSWRGKTAILLWDYTFGSPRFVSGVATMTQLVVSGLLPVMTLIP